MRAPQEFRKGTACTTTKPFRNARWQIRLIAARGTSELVGSDECMFHGVLSAVPVFDRKVYLKRRVIAARELIDIGRQMWFYGRTYPTLKRKHED